MAKSRRITKSNQKNLKKNVLKKGKETKINFVEKLKEDILSYSQVFVLRFSNIKSKIVHKIRESLPDSKLVMGKRRLLVTAIGEGELSDFITGNDFLLLTNLSIDQVKNTLLEYRDICYANTGDVSLMKVVVPAQTLEPLGSGVAVTLRDFGMNIEVKDRKVILLNDYTICEKGVQLTNTQIRLLKTFQVQLGQFCGQVVAQWKDKVLTKFEYKKDISLYDNSYESVKVMTTSSDGEYFFFEQQPLEENKDVEMQ